MEPRITTSTVSFAHPFRLAGHAGELPPGSYAFRSRRNPCTA